jgi:hypothetical protein
LEVEYSPPSQQRIAEAKLPPVWLSSIIKDYPLSPPLLQQINNIPPLSVPPWPAKGEKSNNKIPPH